jgi:hypothetical protein
MDHEISIRVGADEETRAERWGKIALGVVAAIVLSPVAGMVLAFAVIPALPVALVAGAVLGPMNLFENGEAEDEDEKWRYHELHEAHAH